MKTFRTRRDVAERKNDVYELGGDQCGEPIFGDLDCHSTMSTRVTLVAQYYIIFLFGSQLDNPEV